MTLNVGDRVVKKDAPESEVYVEFEVERVGSTFTPSDAGEAYFLVLLRKVR